MYKSTAIVLSMVVWIFGALLITATIKTDNCNHAINAMDTLNKNYALDRMDYATYISSFTIHEDYYIAECK